MDTDLTKPGEDRTADLAHLGAEDASTAEARKALHEENRLSWNEATKAHNSHKLDQARFFREGGHCLAVVIKRKESMQGHGIYCAGINELGHIFYVAVLRVLCAG